MFSEHTTLLLIRHGESEANLERFFAGNLDVALTELGRRQAECTAAFLREQYTIDGIYASDLRRAWDTGCVIGQMLDLPVTAAPGLREIHAGAWQGQTFDRLQTQPEYQRWLTDIGNCLCPGGESVAQLAQRVYAAVEEICRNHPGQTLVVATHATPIRALQWHITGKPLSYMSQIPWVGNASVTELRWSQGTLTPVKISIDSHLADMKTQFPPNV